MPGVSLPIRRIADESFNQELGLECVESNGWSFLPGKKTANTDASHTRLFLLREENLSECDFAEQLLVAKKAYEKLHPETRNGGKKQMAASAIPRFAVKAAATFGVGETAIKELVRLAEKLDSKHKKEWKAGKITKAMALRLLRKKNKSTSKTGSTLNRQTFKLISLLNKSNDFSAVEKEALAELATIISGKLKKGGKSQLRRTIGESGIIRRK